MIWRMEKRISLSLLVLVFALISFNQTGTLLANADSVSYNNTKVCLGSSSGLLHANADQPWLRYQKYVSMYANCTTVLESLEIVFVDGNFSYDMSFLESIREVNGYVLIDGNYFDFLPLKNLRLIRGRTLYYPRDSKVGYSLYVSTNRKSNSTTVGLKEMHLTSLHEILDGNVLIEKNNLLCHVQTINWTDIIGDLSRVQLKPLPQEEYRRSCEECHPSCSFNQVAHCWGPGPEKCQKITNGVCHSNCVKGCFGSGPHQCCNDQCAGGCGHNKSDCWACRHFVNYGICTDKCPGETIYNMKTYKNEPNPDVRYTYGANCLKECPVHMLIEKETCVARCSEGHMTQNNSRKCTLCNNRICPKTCPGGDVERKNVGNFSGCTIIDGYLRILAKTFAGPSAIANVSDLDVFESLEVITGYLLVQGSHPEFNNLSFLRNLRVVNGRMKFSRGLFAIVILKTSLVELGLASLKEISSGSVAIQLNEGLDSLGLVSLERIGDGTVQITNNTNLCYVDSVNWTQIIADKTKTITVKYNANQTNFCESHEKVCSSQCSSDGCWGPLEGDCRYCADFRYGRKCVDSCRFKKGLFADGVKQCQHCHDECIDSCNGTEASDCEECRNVRDGPYCRDKCPEFKYANASGTCEPCHKNCKDGCTGPGDHLGFNGCRSCHLAMELKERKALCLPENSFCPDGFYKFQGRLDVETQNGTEKVRLDGCRQCHDECKTCDGSGSSPTAGSCECKNFKDGDQCVAKCPRQTYSDTRNRCLKCHEECQECYGPTATECTRCLVSRLHEADEDGAVFQNYSIPEEPKIGEKTDVDPVELNATDIERIPAGKSRPTIGDDNDEEHDTVRDLVRLEWVTFTNSIQSEFQNLRAEILRLENRISLHDTLIKNSLQKHDRQMQMENSETKARISLLENREERHDALMNNSFQDFKRQMQMQNTEMKDQFRGLNLKLSSHHCPTGFNYSVAGYSKCYAVLSEGVSWDTAQQRCRQLHTDAQLAILINSREVQITTEILRNHGCPQLNSFPRSNLTNYSNDFWIGARRRNISNCSSPFEWKSNSGASFPIQHSNWRPGEPNCGAQNEACGAITKITAFQWNDLNCSWSICPLCELTIRN